MHLKKNTTFLSMLPFLRFIEGEGGGSGGGTAEGAETAPSGGSSATENASTGTAGTGNTGGETPPAKPAEQSGTGKSGDGSGDTTRLKSALDKERADRKAAEKLASDRAAERTQDQQNHQKVLDDIAVALGVKTKDEPPDAATLARGIAERDARVTSLESENGGLRTELAAWKAAVEHGANPLLLMDRRSFLDELGKLDRKAEKFGEQLDAAVKSAVERDESLKVPGQPRTPRPDPSQGSGRPAPTGGDRGSAEAARRFGTPQRAGTTNT